MVILLSYSIISDVSRLKRVIDMIFECSPRHSISSEQIIDIFSVKDLDSSYKEKCRVILEKETNYLLFKNVIEVVDGAPGKGQVSFENLNEKVLLNKAIVIVENCINDVRFLKYVLKVCGKQKIIDKIDLYWEVSSNGGCGQIPGLAEYKANVVGANRVFVLHDSDRFYPQENLSKTHANIIVKCRELGVAYHTLNKREPENYILDKTLFAVFDMELSYKNAWLSLSTAQKNHYDYKIGFRKHSATGRIYGGLFSSLSSNTAALLENGFGDDIAEIGFSDGNIDNISESDINSHCESIMPEFRKIAEIIEFLL